MVLSLGMTNVEFEKEKSLKEDLAELLLREEIYWREKSRESWIQAGDNNSKFFHASMKAKTDQNNINHVQDGLGGWHDNRESIEVATISHFQNILGSSIESKSSSASSLFDVIPNIITTEDNALLKKPFSLQEIKKATFDNPAFKVIGLDGFLAEFFQRCWSFMGDDILKVVESFWIRGQFVKELNNIVISLIPKKSDPITMDDFRLISLCNTQSKIIAKGMVHRLKPILGRFISEEQHGFVPHREISNNIILAGETIHSMNRKRLLGMIIKLDISKAYERVRWPFLLELLKRFGFCLEWIICIHFCLSTVHFSIFVNGTISGCFQETNGLRQGDPLSPFLFVLMAESLGHLIKKKNRIGCWRGISISKCLDPVMHSQFVDDAILFGEASIREAKCIRSVLSKYEDELGQVMNVQKS